MLKNIAIIGGADKDGAPENVERLTVEAGEVLVVVGPTGSGKSQLIADVEQYGEEETLTGRKVLINGQPVLDPGGKKRPRFLVAQVSQNMNFVIDMSIEEFLPLPRRL